LNEEGASTTNQDEIKDNDLKDKFKIDQGHSKKTTAAAP
jgi:hypothetical protein